MKTKELEKRCARITMAFDGLEYNEGPELRPGGTMQTFSVKVSENKKVIQNIISKCYKNGNLKGDEEGDEESELIDTFCNLEEDLFNVGFALGYCIGLDFDVPYPDIQKDIRAIKQLLKKEKLLPYLPRERGSGSSRSMKRVA